MQKENKDNLTDLVGMVSKPQPKPSKEPQTPGTLTSQDGKPVTLGLDKLETSSLSNTKKPTNRASKGFLSLFGLKYRDDGSETVE